MAVYTHLGAEQLGELIAHYGVGELISAKGIAEGVSNSNWLIETDGAPGSRTRKLGQSERFILTMYERRIELEDLPYFLGLLDHLAASDCPVPRTIHDRDGASFRMVDGKAVALIEFMPGISPTRPSSQQARALGSVLAKLHRASQDFNLTRKTTMGPSDVLGIFENCGEDRLAAIDPDLAEMLEASRMLAALDTSGLPRSNIHADLFPDNVLMLGYRVAGLIDFYFACTDIMVYDLAVTHAAWCFDQTGKHIDPQRSKALIDGYQSVRELTAEERDLLPQVAQAASLRFAASRAEDWLNTPEDALVTRKNPMEFVRRYHTYAEAGAAAFAFAD
ncbi:MAG: homoserine kinase [Pseudomonadota bacterium]